MNAAVNRDLSIEIQDDGVVICVDMEPKAQLVAVVVEVSDI